MYMHVYVYIFVYVCFRKLGWKQTSEMKLILQREKRTTDLAHAPSC